MAEGAAHGRRRQVPRRLARGLASLVYRDIDVRLPPEAVEPGPALAVSNHFGGLSDGVLLVDSAPRMPRIIARDLIWKVPIVGWLATAAGMIPVHRAADGAGTSNDQAFADAYAALRQEDLVLIFPEGVTQDVPYLAKVRTGAARIALGARAAGVPGITVLPVGLHYENKAGFRSRALVNVGDPLDLDSWAEGRPDGVANGADDRAAVLDLTAAIDARLRHAAPDFADWRSAHALETVAEVLLNDVDPASPAGLQYGDQALLAGRLNRLPEPQRTALVDLGADYRSLLSRTRTTDRAVATASAPIPRSWRWLPGALLVLLLLPYAAMGVLAAALPLLAVIVVSRLPIAPAVRATIVPAVALVTFLAEWVAFSWQSLSGGWELGLVAVVLFPFLVAALFYVVEEVPLLWRGWRGRRRPSPVHLTALQDLRATIADLAWQEL
jgi:1-acyl-sn-glycerol-3-phosphate acyltransferase